MRTVLVAIQETSDTSNADAVARSISELRDLLLTQTRPAEESHPSAPAFREMRLIDQGAGHAPPMCSRYRLAR